MDQHPIQGGVEILLFTSCYRNHDKLWPNAATQLVCKRNLTSYLTRGDIYEKKELNSLYIQKEFKVDVGATGANQNIDNKMICYLNRLEKTIWDLAVEERNRVENHSNKGTFWNLLSRMCLNVCIGYLVL